nr:hypothetical protein [Pseudomonas oleovorans]
MFEAVLLAAFSSRIDPAGLVAAMLLYRLFYVVLPLVAAGLLLLAQGLRRRLSAAWALTLVLSLLKDFDWPEALAAIAGLLALFRREFYRRSRLMDVPASGLVLAATAGVIAASVWLLLFAYQDVAYSHQLWWQFGWMPMHARPACGVGQRPGAPGRRPDLAVARHTTEHKTAGRGSTAALSRHRPGLTPA